MRQITELWMPMRTDQELFVVDQDEKRWTLWIDKSGDGQPVVRLVKKDD
jgi:hypothetical protein